jgi:hypothetical protein
MSIHKTISQWMSEQTNKIRLLYIKRIFEYYKELGLENNGIIDSKYWHGDVFNLLYDKRIYELEQMDRSLHLICEQLNKNITSDEYNRETVHPDSDKRNTP